MIIDVNRVIHNSKFTQVLDVSKRTSEYDDFGRPIVAEVNIALKCIVFVSSPKELERLDNYNKVKTYITIYTDTALHIDDVVDYKSTRYKVKSINDYIEYGYYEIIAESIGQAY